MSVTRRQPFISLRFYVDVLLSFYSCKITKIAATPQYLKNMI